MSTISRTAIILHEQIRGAVFDLYRLDEIDPVNRAEILDRIAEDCNKRAELLRDNCHLSYQTPGEMK